MDEPVPQHKSRESLYKRELVIVAGGIILLLAATYLAWVLIYRINAPDSVVKSFIEADRAGRYADQDALISNSWDSTLMLETIQTFRRTTGVSPFDKYRILSTSHSGETASVDVEVILMAQPFPGFPGLNPPGTQTVIVPFQLVRQDNQWKIDPARTMIGLTGVLMATGFQQLMPRLQNMIPPSFGGAASPPAAPIPNPPAVPSRP